MPIDDFITENLHTASAVKTSGEKLAGFARNPEGRGLFRFKNSEKVQKVVKEYYEGTLTQNVRDYVTNWMILKKLVSQDNGG
jgi:hypothetical protein